MGISFKIIIDGYQHLSVNGNISLIAVSDVLSQCRQILESNVTLYEYAEKEYADLVSHASAPPSSDALKFKGRGDVFVLPFGITKRRVAFRHSLRGGLISRFVKDIYLPPTRAIHEIFASQRLAALKIPSPEVVAIAIYKFGRIFRRSDVLTRYIEDSADLSTVLGDVRNAPYKNEILDAVALLLAKLSAGGAQHQDLNLKNVLISAESDGYVAHILDVDRIHFHIPNDPMVSIANMNRLLRSVNKWRDADQSRAAMVSMQDIDYLTSAIAKASKTVKPVTLEEE